MKIEKIKQLKNNNYEVKLEEGKPFLFSGDTIIKYELLLKKKLDLSKLEEIKKYDEVMQIYNKYINKLKKKMKTEKEILSLLDKENLSSKEINFVLEKLKKIKLINDQAYLDAYINDSIILGTNGPNKIKKQLIELGFSTAEINNKLSQINQEAWDEKVKKIVLKKSKNSKCSQSILKQKIQIYLINMGYNVNINEYFNFNYENDLKIIEKDFIKLSKKYDRKNIEINLKNKKIYFELLKKGYSSEIIEKIIALKN